MDAEDYDILSKIIGNEKIYCETIPIEMKEHKEYYFVPDDQNIQSAPEALSKATDEFKALSSLLKIFGHNKNNIQIDSATEVYPDGTRTNYLIFSDIVMISDEIYIYANGTLLDSKQNTEIENMKNIYANVQTSQEKYRLLNYMGKEKSWVNAYHIYELLKHYYIQENDLKKIPELATFAHTANSPHAVGEDARHSVQTVDKPKKIANLDTSYKKLIELSLKYITE